MTNTAKSPSKRRIIRCTFQAEGNTRIGRFFDFLSSSLEEQSPRELMQEASEVYWMPVHLFYQYRAGEITSDQFRQRVLRAIAQQEAWINYCRRLTEVDPVPQVVQNQSIYMRGSEPLPVSSSQVLDSASSMSSEEMSARAEVEEASVSTSSVQVSENSFKRRRPQSMKPAFGGAFLQDD